MPDKIHWTQLVANISTSAACILAAITIIFGYKQFKDSQELQRSIKATELFMEFNRLQADLDKKKKPQKTDKDFWVYNNIFSLTEAIYILTKDDRGWVNTVTWMLNEQQMFLESHKFRCNTLDNSFVRMIKRSHPNFECE